MGEMISWLVLHQIHCGSVQLMAIVVEIWDDSMYHIAPTLTLLATLWAPWTMTRWHVDVVGMLERRIMRWCGFKT